MSLPLLGLVLEEKRADSWVLLKVPGMVLLMALLIGCQKVPVKVGGSAYL